MKIKNRTKVIVAMVLVVLILLFVRNGIVRKEKYLTPETKCFERNAPTWCPDEYSMAYSSDAASTSDHSFYNDNTGLCTDGTRDCIYVEKYNDQRVLQGVFNNKNVDLGQKFLDDVYAGNITFSPDSIDEIRNNAKFENGTMKVRNEGDTTWYTLQVGIKSADQQQRLAGSNILVVPPSLFLLYVAIYFKANNLPKPTIKYELKSPMSMKQLRESAPPPRVLNTPTPTPTPEATAGP